MRVLHHHSLSPGCRKVRIALAEKRLPFHLQPEAVWERRPEFLELNPAGEVPVLVEEDDLILSDSTAICEYLDETVPEPLLIGRTPGERAEVRRLVAWFDVKFNAEVTQNLVGEKVMRRILRCGHPDSGAIRAGHANIRTHLEYISFLVERRNWLAGDLLTLADIAAAAHLSCVDYLGDVPWATFEEAKTWYVRMKSRPSLRAILGDTIPGLPPVDAYADLDF